MAAWISGVLWARFGYLLFALGLWWGDIHHGEEHLVLVEYCFVAAWYIQVELRTSRTEFLGILRGREDGHVEDLTRL